MSSLDKANRFIRKAKECGWTVKWSAKDDYLWVQVIATRANEEIVIEWQDNQLAYSPKYRFNDMERKLHSRAVAEQVVAATKPDVAAYQRWRNGAKRTVAAPAQPQANSEQELEASLPFDIKEDLDSTILKAVRGNTILWKSSISGQVESCWVPWRVSDGKGRVRVFNADTQNVFYLSTASNGRDYLSFMDLNGQFRAVHLDSLIGVL